MNQVSLIGTEYEVDMSAIKMEQVASHLIGLLRHRKISRTELAHELGWSKGRVTKILSGDVNLTLKTITAIAQKLGYDFDVVFHNINYDKPKQPWQVDQDKRAITLIPSQQNIDEIGIVFQVETGSQVVDAVLAGKEKGLYISVSPSSKSLEIGPIPIIPEIASHNTPINITYFNQDLKVPYHE